MSDATSAFCGVCRWSTVRGYPLDRSSSLAARRLARRARLEERDLGGTADDDEDVAGLERHVGVGEDAALEAGAGRHALHLQDVDAVAAARVELPQGHAGEGRGERHLRDDVLARQLDVRGLGAALAGAV